MGKGLSPKPLQHNGSDNGWAADAPFHRLFTAAGSSAQGPNKLSALQHLEVCCCRELTFLQPSLEGRPKIN